MTVEALPAPATRARLDAVRRRHGAVCGGAVPAGGAADCLARGVRLYRSRAQRDARQFRHAVHRPRIRRAAPHHAHHRHLRQLHLLPGRRADGLDRGAHRRSPRPHHPHVGDGLVRDAAVPRRHRLGAAGSAQQRSPEPTLSRRHRRRPRYGAVQHLLAPRSDLRHLLLHLSIRVRIGRQCARSHSRRPRGRLHHAGRQRLAHRTARDDSAGATGIGRGRARCLPAGHDAVRLARHPGPAGRLPHYDDQDLEPVSIPAEARACRRRSPAAAGADGGAVARPGVRIGPARLYGDRRQERGSPPRAARVAALAGTGTGAGDAVPARVPALRRAGERRLLAYPLAAHDVRHAHAAQRQVRVLRALRHQARHEEHVPAWARLPLPAAPCWRW